MVSNDTKAADFGFDKPLVTGTVTYPDDTEYAFELGDETPLEDGYYFPQGRWG